MCYIWLIGGYLKTICDASMKHYIACPNQHGKKKKLKAKDWTERSKITIIHDYIIGYVKILWESTN